MSVSVEARDLTASLPGLPGLAEKGPDGKIHGSLVDLVKAIDDVYEEGKIIVRGPYPFKRSIFNVVKGNADFHPILIKGANPEGFVYSSVRIAVLSEVLYTNSDKPRVDKNNLWKYKFDTGPSGAEIIREEFLKRFNKSPEIYIINTPKQGLLRVSIGRTDGYIKDMDSCDAVIRKLKLKNIRRELFVQRDVHAVVPLGSRGKEVDEILTKALGKLREQKRLMKLVYKLHKPWIDWQPYEMDW